MKMILQYAPILGLLLLIVAMAWSCEKEGGSAFGVNATAVTVTEGETLPITLRISGGSSAVSYDIDGTLCEYSITTDSEGEQVASVRERDVKFSDGKRTLPFDGLKAGTYRLRVAVSGGSCSGVASCVAVITPKDGGDDNPGGGEGGDGPDNPGGEGDDPAKEEVADFSIPAVSTDTDKVMVEWGEDLSFTPVAVDAEGKALTTPPVFSAACSDEDVATAAVENGVLVIHPVAPGNASVTVSADGGPTKSFPIRVHATVEIRAYVDEQSATDVQIRTKTFPCQIRFESTPKVPFKNPVVWHVAMSAVVNVPGKDVIRLSDRKDVSHTGAKNASYNVKENILVPAYTAARDASGGNTEPEFTLSLTLSVQRDASFDATLWTVSYKDDYLTQNDTRLAGYLTEILQ